MKTLQNIFPTNTLAWAALVMISFLWGTTFLAVKIGVEYMPGFLLTGIRHLVAGALLLGYAILTKRKAPSRRSMLLTGLLGVLTLGMGNGIVAWAEESIDSGLAAILCALTPAWMVVFSIVLLNRGRLTFGLLAGMIIGVIGVAILFSDSVALLLRPESFMGIMAIMVANICWALGSVLLMKWNLAGDKIYSAGLQMTMSGVVLTSGFYSFVGYVDLTQIDFNAYAAIAYLAVVGSVISYMAYMYVIAKLPPALSGIYAYINPIVALWLGWLILSEQVDIWMWVGTGVTLLGIYVINYSNRKTQSSAVDAAPVAPKIKWWMFALAKKSA